MLIRASFIAFITIVGMGGQFLIRAVLTAHIGPGEQLDVFFITMGWAGALASAVFQAVAMVLAPQTVGAGASSALRGLSRGTSQVLIIVATLIAVLAAIAVAIFGHISASPVVLFVLLGWGVAGGQVFFQRQLLLAWGQPFAPALLALIPAVVILSFAWCGVIEDTLGFAVVGFLAWGFVAGLGAMLLWQSWRRRGVPQASAAPAGAIRRLLYLAAPVFGANWNSQANQRSQDVMAAIATAGGATIFGNAIALARLPATIADSIFSSIAYTRILDAIAAKDATALLSAYRLALRAHFAITVPVAAAVMVAGDAATQVLFAHGKCSIEDTRAIATVLWWTAPGMVISSLQCVHSQILLAHGRTAAVLRVELIYTVLSIGFTVLVLPFLGLPGIPIAASVAFALIQVPMVRLLAPLGLRWKDVLSELVRACLPALPACLLGVLVTDLCGPLAWVKALVAGGIILAVTLPCSAWAIVQIQRQER